MIFHLSEILCSQISLINPEKLSKKKSSEIIRIRRDDNVGKASKIPLLIPNKKTCFLFDINTKLFELQEFEIDGLPVFPKTILLPNGDLHIIGGVDENENVVDTHHVFRTRTSEIYNLDHLKVPRNPENGLIYLNRKIYLMGGLNEKKEWERSCFCYNMEQKEWI